MQVSNLQREIHGALTKARALASEAARSPIDNALLRVVAQIPAHDYDLLREWKSGLRYWEIAKQRGMSDEAVLRSLARIYADLRLKTMPGEDPPGNELVEMKRDRAA